jgi:hypothetical protein
MSRLVVRGAVMDHSSAEPLDLDDKHEVIRWVEQECKE